MPYLSFYNTNLSIHKLFDYYLKNDKLWIIISINDLPIAKHCHELTVFIDRVFLAEMMYFWRLIIIGDIPFQKLCWSSCICMECFLVVTFSAWWSLVLFVNHMKTNMAAYLLSVTNLLCVFVYLITWLVKKKRWLILREVMMFK